MATLNTVLALVVTAGLLAVSGTAGRAAPAKGPANPYSPAYGHPYRFGVVPSLSQMAKTNAWSAGQGGAGPDATSGPPIPGNVSYGGGVDGIGVTTATPKVYLVFWGPGWGTQSTDANGNVVFTGDTYGGAAKLQMMFKGLGTGGELWSGTATEYCEGVPAGTPICGTGGPHVPYPNGNVLAGVWYDPNAAAFGATAHQIGVEAVNAASHFGNTTPALNRAAQYVILTPSQYYPDSFPNAGYCAWHDWNGDTHLDGGGAVTSGVGDVAFTNMPYLMDIGTSCGMNYVNSGPAGYLDGYTMIAGHEYVETITDQNPPGGFTGPGGEVADKCLWIPPGSPGGAANVVMGNGTYVEQTVWSNYSRYGTGQCEIAQPVYAPPAGLHLGNRAVGRNQDGRLEVFATDSQGAIWHDWQLTPGATNWSGWVPMFGNDLGLGQPTVGQDADGRLEVKARGADGAIWTNWQTTPNGLWNGWATHGGTNLGTPAIGRNLDGRLELFAADTSGVVWCTWQTAANGSWTASWSSLGNGGVALGTPTVGQDADGRLEVYARGTDGAIWANWQNSPGGAWHGWATHGGTNLGTPAVGRNKDGRLELFATDTSGAVWHTWQATANGSWTTAGWSNLGNGGSALGVPTVGQDADGRLEVYGTTGQAPFGLVNPQITTGVVWSNWQNSPGGAWHGWASHGGAGLSNPAVINNKDGRLEMFASDSTGTIWHKWQTAPNSSWTAWTML